MLILKFKGTFIKGIAAIIIILYLLGSNSLAMVSENDLDKFKSKLDNIVPQLQKRYKVPGTSIGIIKNGKVEYILNYGTADKKGKKPVTNDTIFQAASVSKSLSAFGIMHLADEGRINIDDPAEKYLTKWHIPDSKFNKDDVTIRRLLNHTAGLSIYGYGGTKPGKKLFTTEEALSKEQGGVKIESKPGSRFSYSGGGYTVLQLIIEEVTKMPFDKYMQNEILTPLGMMHSSYRNDFTDSNMSKAYGYFNNLLPNYNFTEEAAAGLKTTVSDFSKFIITAMDSYNGEVKEKGIISRDSMALIKTSAGSNYQLGGYISKMSNNNTLIYHYGNNIGWCSYYGMIPENEDGLIIFTNSDNGMDVVFDVKDAWIKYETGKIEYDEIDRIRTIIFHVPIVIASLLVLYLIHFAVKLKKGIRTFMPVKSKKHILKLFLRLLVCIIIGFCWYYVFYVSNLALISAYRIKLSTYLLYVWLIGLFINGLFTKPPKRLKSR